MRIWILSDLHLESTRGWDLPPADARPQFDVLVVAGDLITRMERGVNGTVEIFETKRDDDRRLQEPLARVIANIAVPLWKLDVEAAPLLPGEW
ncbi:metallophosphoesterase [Tardiphaga sp. 42S5]|uniref:metallophosphoesterase n=1 Tax=Tardiphaga sp. 42S5 TaxID=1404799 RepID=UPI002A59995B|nr:metallophosphoesterase [Tardiphaga sp. 42S5]WPO42871.1 metallophosphoesterase [Tardiphaga sp. 42S5]